MNTVGLHWVVKVEVNYISAETCIHLSCGTGRNCMPKKIASKRKTKTCSGNRLSTKGGGSVTRNSHRAQTCHGVGIGGLSIQGSSPFQEA